MTVKDLQGRETESTTPDAPGTEKASNVSYLACNNSYQSQMLCWRS